MHRAETVLAQVEIRKAVACRGGEQRAVITVGPAVVGAGDAAEAMPASLEQPRATVTAGVAQRTDRAARIAQHDHAVAAELERHVVAGARDLADVTGDLPA